MVERDRDAVKHRTMHNAAPIPTPKNYLAPNDVTSSNTEKPWLGNKPENVSYNSYTVLIVSFQTGKSYRDQ